MTSPVYFSRGRQTYLPHMKQLDAVITIYLSLTLLISSALICTLIESARISVLNSKYQSLTYMAADSVFSEFAQPLFDEYGVMTIWTGEEEFLQEFKEFSEKNLEYDEVQSLVFTDLYGGTLSDQSLTDIDRITDDNGSIFAEQVMEYMKYFLADDAVSRIIGSTSIFEQGDKVSAFMDKVESYKGTFTKVENAVATVKDKIDKAKTIANNPSSILSSMSSSISAYINGDESAASDFSRQRSSLASAQSSLTNRLNAVERATDNYYDCVSDARDAINNLQSDLETDRSEFDDDIYNVVSEQLDDLEQKSADTDFDYYLVGANSDTTSSYISQLDSLDGLFSQTSGGLTKDNAQTYLSVVNSYSSDFSGFSLDNLGVNFEQSAITKENSGFLDSISNLFNNGILGFVAGDVSEKSIDFDEMPSAIHEHENISDSASLLDAAEDKAIFGEYILQHFSNCGEVKDNCALDYESEYIIAGKTSDSDNLAAVVSDIALIRSGCNLISILKSTAKKAETAALATSLVGFTEMPVLVKVFQILIIAAWALAESIIDVKVLIEGGKVKTIKDDSDWFLSLSSIKSFTGVTGDTPGNSSGLTYASYLRLLLLAQDKEVQYYRTMDMVQADMCLRENEDFRMSECITGVQIQAKYTAPQLFVTFPFVSSIISVSDSKYAFTIVQDYSY